MLKLTDKQQEILGEIIRRGGAASSADLGGYSTLGNRARTKLRDAGLAFYDGRGSKNGLWRITDAGQEAWRNSRQQTSGA